MVRSPASIGRSSPSPSRDDSPAQARLLRVRGDLVHTTRSFDANLSEPGARAKPLAAHRPLTRLGLEVKRAGEAMDLSVSSIDTGLAQATPVSQWNSWEARKAMKAWSGAGEPLPIRPGDRICAVNGVDEDQAMVGELLSAASMSDPKPVSLRLERPNSAVLERSSPCRRGQADALPSDRPPALPSRASSAPRARRRGDLESSGSQSQLAQACFADVRPPRLPSPWIPSKSSKVKRSNSRDEEASTRSPSWSASTSRSSSVNFGEQEDQRAACYSTSGPGTRSPSPAILPSATASWSAMRRGSRIGRR